MISKGVIKCNHYAFAALSVRVAEKEGSMFNHVLFRKLFIDAVNEKVSLPFSLFKIKAGVASKLLLNASATGQMIKFSFFSLSVF